MDREMIRLELVKLLARGGRPQAEALAEIRVYEDYIFEESVKSVTVGAKKPPSKKGGNPDFLD